MSNEGNKSKTKIFIPAGTVPADKNAVLEVSFDGNQSMVAKKVSEKVKRISSAPSTSYSTCSQRTRPETSCNNEWQQKEQEERDKLLHQLDQYQKARRQYLGQLSKNISKPDNYFGHLDAVSIANQACCTNKSVQIQTVPYSFCDDESTQTYPQQQKTYPTDGFVSGLPSFFEPQFNSTINSNLAPCYSNIQQNTSKEHCDLCDRLYNKTFIDDKETKELWKNDNQKTEVIREAFPSHSDNDIGDIMNKLKEAKMKLDKCKSLIGGNDDCNLRNEFQFANYSPCCSFDRKLPKYHCKPDDLLDSQLKQSEEDFKKRTEQLKQTLTKLLNTVSSEYINMFGDEHSQSNLTDTRCQSASYKSILKHSTDSNGSEFKKNVTVCPGVETILLKKEETPKEVSKMKCCPHHPETNVNQLESTVIACPQMKTPQPEKRQEPCVQNSCRYHSKNEFDPEKQFAYDLGSISMNSKISTPRKVPDTESTRVQIKSCRTENHTCSHKQ